MLPKGMVLSSLNKGSDIYYVNQIYKYTYIILDMTLEVLQLNTYFSFNYLSPLLTNIYDAT